MKGNKVYIEHLKQLKKISIVLSKYPEVCKTEGFEGLKHDIKLINSLIRVFNKDKKDILKITQSIKENEKFEKLKLQGMGYSFKKSKRTNE